MTTTPIVEEVREKTAEDVQPRLSLLPDGSWLAFMPEGHPWTLGVFGADQETARRLFAVALAHRAALLAS